MSRVVVPAHSRLDNVTDWQNFYHDDINSFEYVSLTDMKKEYYGLEAGVKFKITSAFDVKLLGTISDAKIINSCYCFLFTIFS